VRLRASHVAALLGRFDVEPHGDPSERFVDGARGGELGLFVGGVER